MYRYLLVTCPRHARAATSEVLPTAVCLSGRWHWRCKGIASTFIASELNCKVKQEGNFKPTLESEIWHGLSQGRIKGFVGPKHFSSLDPFGESRSIVGTIVYSRLSWLTEGEGKQRQLRNTNNLNFVFYTLTVNLARQTDKCALLTYLPLRRQAYSGIEKNYFKVLYFILYCVILFLISLVVFLFL
jgi:hypothetical protein